MTSASDRPAHLSDSEPAAVHILCGLVAAGKTTLARQLAVNVPAARLSRDEWMIRLYGPLSYDDPAYVERLGPCTELLWDVAFEILEAGTSVVLDWNFWTRQRRAEALTRASQHGYQVRVHWLDVPLEEVVRRARERLDEAPFDVHPIDEEGVRHFATIFEPPAEDEGLQIELHG